jgi:hypothetical protein
VLGRLDSSAKTCDARANNQAVGKKLARRVRVDIYQITFKFRHKIASKTAKMQNYKNGRFEFSTLHFTPLLYPKMQFLERGTKNINNYDFPA